MRVAAFQKGNFTAVCQPLGKEDFPGFRGGAVVGGPDGNGGARGRTGPGTGSRVCIRGLNYPTSVDFSPGGDAFLTVGGVGAPGSGAAEKHTKGATPAPPAPASKGVPEREAASAASDGG